MAIDNPLDQALEQVAAEDRQRSPFAKAILAISAAVVSGDVGGAVHALKTLGEGVGQDRAEYLLGLVIPEVNRLAERFDLLEKQRQEYLDRDWPQLFLDAERRARETRGRERIARIAKILTAAAHTDPPPLPDKTEELIRIAAVLDDLDVRVLAVLVDGQRRGFTPGFGRVNEKAANHFWRHGDPVHQGGSDGVEKGLGESAVSKLVGLSEGELQSVCAKLQSYGLVVPVERDRFINFQGTIPYAVLARGFDFVDSIRSSNAD